MSISASDFSDWVDKYLQERGYTFINPELAQQPGCVNEDDEDKWYWEFNGVRNPQGYYTGYGASYSALLHHIEQQQGEHAKGRRSAIEDLFKLLPVEGYEFYYNEPNDYGCINFKWFCGQGDPRKQYMGEPQMGMFYKRGKQPTDRYYLNEAAVDTMLAAINSKPTPRT